MLFNLCFSSQNALEEMQRVSQQRIQEREKELADLREATQMLTVSVCVCVCVCVRAVCVCVSNRLHWSFKVNPYQTL